MENNKGLRKAKQPCSLELNGSKKYPLPKGNSGFYNLFQSRRRQKYKQYPPPRPLPFSRWSASPPSKHRDYLIAS